jgi:hypothetical protein
MDMNHMTATRTRSIGAHGVWYAILVACWGISGPARGIAAVAGQTAPPGFGNAVVYDLKETSAFDLPDAVRFFFIMGRSTICRQEPNEQVRRYPKFKSSQPLYGSLRVGTPYGSRDPGLCYQYAIDESGGTGRGYDRLYVDTDLNGDLTDDDPAQRRRDVPGNLYPPANALKMSVCFDGVRIRVDPKGEAERRLEVMPHLRLFRGGGDRIYVSFIPAKVRTGLVQLGPEKFQAFLGHDRSLPGWLDYPTTSLHFLPADRPELRTASWVGGRMLSSTHRYGDVFYRFSATPEGDQLFVRQYQGPLGTFEIRAGTRDIADLSASGSLALPDTIVALTEDLDSGGAKAVRSCRLPVGDYSPYVLDVTYGRLKFSVTRNYHDDGRPRARILDPRGPGTIRIRADKPFVLDFSGRPQILFAAPARDQRVKRGDVLDVKAVLIDPALEIMFRQISHEKTLDPTVVIRRANGAVVAEGVMPFG